MSFGILETILGVLLTVLVASIIFRRFQIPVILGYVIVGALLGPHALGFIPDADTIKKLAEFGIVFLMFTVGLEFSKPRLFALKNAVFVIGGLQVLLSVVISTGIGMLLGMSMLSALVVGGIVAMSSTALVIKQLDDQSELYTSHGLNAVGVLLFQDLAVIPFIILIVGLSTNGEHSLTTIFLWAILKGILAIFLMSILGRGLKSIFHLIVKTRALELFTLTVLLSTLTAAWLTNLLGLSFSLGAFLAGIMLSETEFRHQIEIEIRPFRDILLGLFFITIGMLADVGQWYTIWIWIALLLCALVLGKMLLIALISRLTGNNYSVSLRTGIILAQGSEFGFAILTLALSYNMLPADYGQVILAALLISLAISPLFIFFNKTIANWFLPKSMETNDELVQQKISEKTKELQQHIIICGYGRVGQQIAKILNKTNYAYIGLDIDSELIKQANLLGEKVLFGDASHPGILHAAGIDRAKALVISFDKLKPAKRVLSIAKGSHPDLPILVRCKDQIELEELKKYHPTKIIAETFEESLTLSKFLLKILEIPTKEISELMEKARKKDYDLLRKVFSSPFDEDLTEDSFLNENLMPILLPEDAYAVNHTLSEFDVKSIDIEVIGIRRGKSKPIKPSPNFKLCANDILIIYGSAANIESAERLFLEGN